MADPGISPDGANDLSLSAADAEVLLAQAEALRVAAADGGDPLWRAETIARAKALEAVAAQVFTTAPALASGSGGEVAQVENSDDPWPKRKVARASRTQPDLLDAEASLERLDLARTANALPLAIDAAERSGAASPAEQMLAHQMAAAHAMAMRLLGRADAFLARRFILHQPSAAAAEAERKAEQVASIEAGRLSTAAARMMEATARAALALDRLRHGNRQTILVQHVEVQDGGQAVVQGAIAPPDRPPRGGSERT
ncbi:MAG TPA: hypothetical protein VNZ61_21070 [Roseomonas sp.]|nr:hypothetical protein [Roseomonas sp.]